jgi:hypothetical protein
MPLDAPVTTATLPESLFEFALMSLFPLFHCQNCTGPQRGRFTSV